MHQLKVESMSHKQQQSAESEQSLVGVLTVTVPINSRSFPAYMANPDGLFVYLSSMAASDSFDAALQTTTRNNAASTALPPSAVTTRTVVVNYLASVNLQYVYPPTAAPTSGVFTQSNGDVKGGGNSNLTMQIAVSLAAFLLLLVVLVCIVFNYRRQKQKQLEEAAAKYTVDENGRSATNDEDPLVSTDSIYGEMQDFSYDSSIAASEASSQMHRNPHRKHFKSNMVSEPSATNANKPQQPDGFFMHNGFNKTESDLIFTNPFHKTATVKQNRSKDKDVTNAMHNVSINSINTMDTDDSWGLNETRIVFDKKLNKTLTF